MNKLERPYLWLPYRGKCPKCGTLLQATPRRNRWIRAGLYAELIAESAWKMADRIWSRLWKPNS